MIIRANTTKNKIIKKRYSNTRKQKLHSIQKKRKEKNDEKTTNTYLLT